MKEMRGARDRSTNVESRDDRRRFMKMQLKPLKDQVIVITGARPEWRIAAMSGQSSAYV
jgi:hypothetical protein